MTREVPASMTELDVVVESFRKWLYMPDSGALVALLGAVAANLMGHANPVWLLLVGPPSSGKTEMLSALADLPYTVRFSSTMTVASLLSGSSKGSRTLGSSGGLLREIGDFGFLIHKEFTTVLEMCREARKELLAALREIHDGSWVRCLGVDGGRNLPWKGKLAFLAGCTEAIDQAHSVTSIMGPRFVFYRMPPTDAFEQSEQALDDESDKEAQKKKELSESVKWLFDGLPDRRALTAAPRARVDKDRLGAMARLAVSCRSAVERHYYTRQVELVPEVESPARMAHCLSGMLAGLRVLEVSPDQTWDILLKISLDSMTGTRRRIFDCVRRESGIKTSAVAEGTGIPYSTALRSLEDLKHLKVLVEQEGGKAISLIPDRGRPGSRWSLSALAQEQFEIASGGKR